MRAHLPLLLTLTFPVISCEPAAEDGSSAVQRVETPPPTEKGREPVTSIMRPEVAQEVSIVPPAPPKEPLSAVVTFADTEGELEEDAKHFIDTLLKDPRFPTAGKITLSGHTDSTGSDADNLATSRQRAEAVRDYLVSKGISEDRIAIIALGERRPIAPNANLDGSDYPEGRQRNRRVVIHVATSNTHPIAPRAHADARNDRRRASAPD